ncbi:MAG TPA: hypothetical protein PKJ41_06520 [Bryobacteraceae bacterium]|nr:hypothetical protein [Bryobacteraceae bacterium]HPT27145.1 hypothetical protein [Bryobacteraceae bacterium]
MSEAAFQSAFVRLVTDEAFLNQMRSEAVPEIDGLSEGEADGLKALARVPGLNVMRKLHLGFRLNKLLSMLPLTCRLLGQVRLAAEARAFWEMRPSASFYFLEEAEAFAVHLQERRNTGLRAAYLGDVLAYESALLMLKRPRAASAEAPVVKVGFRYDPQTLLLMVQQGVPPRRIPRAHVELLGWADEQGEVHWTAA